MELNAISSKTNNQMTPLFAAAEVGNTDMMDLLLSRGANFMYQTDNGDTILHCAYLASADAVEFVLSKALQRSVCNELRALGAGETMRDRAVQDLQKDHTRDSEDIRQCIALYDNLLQEILKRKTGYSSSIAYINARATGMKRRRI